MQQYIDQPTNVILNERSKMQMSIFFMFPLFKVRNRHNSSILLEVRLEKGVVTGMGS